ncbi:hypothetical protein RBB50_002244 [Rhinocladiella similis]
MATTQLCECSDEDTRAALDSFKKTSVLQDLTSIENQVIVITGGGDGIGQALVRAVLEVKGRVAVIGLRDSPSEEFWEATTLAKDSQLKYYSADVSKYDELKRIFDQIVRDFDSIDGLIACAGICIEKPFLDHSKEDVYKLLGVNSAGLLFSVQLACRAMMKNNIEERASRGSVILIGSIATTCHCESQGLSAYSASKGAAKGLLHGLSVELAPLGIRVNMISPGHTVTNMSVGQFKARPELETIMKQAVPMGRMGHRRDLKGAAIYYLSNASLYTTGSEVVISGGLHAGRL